MNQYSQPAAADKFDLKNRGQEFLGKLLLIWPTHVMHNVQTSNGICDTVVEADIAIPDYTDPTTGRPFFFQGARLWWQVLVNQTKTEVGGTVLGRLGQGANTKGNPPWMLLDYTPQDVALADQYQAAFPRNAPTQPSAASNGGQPWQNQQAPAQQPPAAAQQSWQAPAQQGNGAAPAPQQNQWQQPSPPQASASTPQANWNAGGGQQAAPGPSPATAQPTAPTSQSNWQTWPPGLADFLKSKNLDVNNIPDEATARQIAATYQG